MEGFLTEFYTDQIVYADLIFYSCVDEVTDKIKEMNPHAVIYEEFLCLLVICLLIRNQKI